MTKATGWHDHHIDYRVHGGSNALSNRVLLHPHCHMQVHHTGLNVLKPALLLGLCNGEPLLGSFIGLSRVR
jgi:RNA-directed DNA polymerase